MKKELEKEKIQLKEYIMSKKYGEVIEWHELQEFTKFDLSEELDFIKFKRYLMQQVKKDLFKCGIVLKSIRFVGYYILKPNQIASFTYRNYIRKPLNKLELADTILKSTNLVGMQKGDLYKHHLTIKLNEELRENYVSILNNEKYKECNN